MRIAAMIFATLFLLATAGLGFLATNRGLEDASAIDEVSEQNAALLNAAAAGSDEARTLVELSEQTGSLRAGAVFYGIAGLCALALLGLTFWNRKVPIAAGALMVAVLIGTFLSPQYDMGPMAPASARSLGYVLAVLAAIGTASAFAAFARGRQNMTRARA